MAQPDYTEKGLTGLNYTLGGYIDEEYLPNLRGRQAIRVYTEMSTNDPTVGTILFAIDMLLRQVEWFVEAHPEATDTADQEFLKSVMDDMSHSWSDFVSEIMSMLVYGWSAFEIVYKRRRGKVNDEPEITGDDSRFSDGKIGWKKFALRSQDSLERWLIRPDGSLQGMLQKPPPEYKDRPIPIGKMLLFRTSTYKNNPEGRSILRRAYRPWFYKKRFEEIEGTGVERDIAGMPFAEVDPAILSPNATTEQRAVLAAIQEIIKNVRQDREAGIIWPLIYDDQGRKMYEFKLMSSAGSRAHDLGAIIQRLDQRIAMVALSDFILMGHEQVGSYALSSDKTNLFAVALGTWLKSIEDVLNRYAVPRLFHHNNLPLDKLPKIKHGDIEKPNLQELATFLATLTSIGMPTFPDDNLENYIRKVSKLPEPTDQAASAFRQRQDTVVQQMLSELVEAGEFPPQMQAILSASGLGTPEAVEEQAPGAQESPPEGPETAEPPQDG